MKHFLLVILAFFSINTSFSQSNPVKWSTGVEKISDTEYKLIYKAEIQDKWHLYSQNIPEGGALPTEFEFDSIAQIQDFNRIGKVLESPSITKFDKVFQMDLSYFDGSATFTQKIKLLSPNINKVESEVFFQACDDEKCIFDSEVLTFNIPKNEKVESEIYDPIHWQTK
ncbi:MAG: protein-disulfide reductase DsbD domain-containing protein, partial [Oceanihabitans sp.]